MSSLYRVQCDKPYLMSDIADKPPTSFALKHSRLILKLIDILIATTLSYVDLSFAFSYSLWNHSVITGTRVSCNTQGKHMNTEAWRRVCESLAGRKGRNFRYDGVRRCWRITVRRSARQHLRGSSARNTNIVG